MSKILCVVDIFDALTQMRHYKEAMSVERAFTVLRDEARRGRIDHRLVELFIEARQAAIARGATGDTDIQIA